MTVLDILLEKISNEKNMLERDLEMLINNTSMTTEDIVNKSEPILSNISNHYSMMALLNNYITKQVKEDQENKEND